MSKNRENIAWQSADGSWNIGFYDYYSTGSYDDDDYDDEWDVEYTNRFHWVSTGHPSEAAAVNAWSGPNPGGGGSLPYKKESEAETLELDDMAAQTYIAAQSKASDYRFNQHPTYRGPAKRRLLRFVARDLYHAKFEADRHELQGYSNPPDERIPGWQEQVDAVDWDKVSPENVKVIEAERKRYVNKLQELVDTSRKNRRPLQTMWPDERRRQWEQQDKLSKLEEKIKDFSNPLAKSKPANASAPKNAEANNSKSSSSQKYHISPSTGRPNICRATKTACPYGGAEAHYDSKDQARKAYEKSMGSGLTKLRK